MSRKKKILMPSEHPDDIVCHPKAASTPAVVPPASTARKSLPPPNALALLKALRRRRLLAATCGLLASTLAVVGVWFGMPIKYTASTILHVSMKEPKVIGGDVAHGDFSIYQNSQAAMMTSRLVLNAVLKDAEMAKLSILLHNPDAQIEWLQKELKVDFRTGPEFMKVSMVGHQPEEMKTLLNTLTAVYLKEVVDKERTQKQRRLDRLEEIQDRFEENLRTRREKVRRLVLQLGARDPKVLAAKQLYAMEALGVAQKELHQVQSDVRRVKAELKAREGQEKFSLVELRSRLDFSLELEKSLLGSVELLRKQTNAANVGQADVELLELEIAQAEKLSERVAAEVETLRLELDAPRRVDLLEEASASLGNVKQQRTKATAGAGAAALFFVIGLIAWREYRYRRLDSAHELTHDLGMKVVGTLPILRSATRALLPWQSASPEGWQDIHTEWVDATRTRLLQVAREKDARVVLVTSAVGGEGKTSLSCHLAGSLARASFRTLLIDGDMRRPSIHRAFDVAARAGLSELLRQEVELDQVIHETAIAGLWLIAAGRWDQSATSALARTRLRALLKTLRKQYEYIIIDSAPLLPVVDSLLIGQHADGVILSVLREVSQLPHVNTAVERLESVGVRILGVIVNGAAADAHTYRYGYAPELPPQVERLSHKGWGYVDDE